MKIIISGGTGLIGRALAQSLLQDGHDVVVLTRSVEPPKGLPAGIQLEKWDGCTADSWGHLADSADVIVNLAGENLAGGRWNEQRKRAILESRTHSGAAIVVALQRAVTKPRMLIQASAVGYYGPGDAQFLGEGALPGSDFLSQVCQAWEASTQPVETLGVRRVVVRLGVVFDRTAGALPRMLLPFRLFAGGPLGSGRQWLSWVHIEDQVRALRFLMESPDAQGVYNISANPLSNRQFARAVGKVMHRPVFLPVPAFVIRLLLGEMSTVVLDGQHVSAKRLTDLGFEFQFPEAEMALRDLLSRRK
jgi:uncharacterized protein